MLHIFDTVSLNSVNEIKKNKSIHTYTIHTSIGPMTTVAGVFFARLWEVVRALCHFSK